MRKIEIGNRQSLPLYELMGKCNLTYSIEQDENGALIVEVEHRSKPTTFKIWGDGTFTRKTEAWEPIGFSKL